MWARNLFETFTNSLFRREYIRYFSKENVGEGLFGNLTFFGSDYIFPKNPFFRRNNILHFTTEEVAEGTF